MNQRFSTRTGWDLQESALTGVIRRARASGKPLYDLTVSNPTVCGFDYDADAILGALVHPGVMSYDPDPRGMRSAREAVTQYYADHGASVDADQVVLTTSTSEAYGYLFRLLCDAGDDVLVAQPSYPLFDFVGDLADVRLQTYPLFYDFGWWIDFAELERRIGPRTRAILLVHPNNPTGHTTGREERTRLEELCVRHGLALIVDEVFLDFGIEAPVRSFAEGQHPALTFTVSGLSKIAGLPQMKVAWVAAFGPEEIRAEALGRLEMIADTFLSMSAPVQRALPVWLAGRGSIQEQIRTRVRENLAALRGMDVLRCEAGWSAVLRLPERGLGEEMVARLVEEYGVIVHPGSFYGMREKSRVVISLIGPTKEFEAGVSRLRELNVFD